MKPIAIVPARGGSKRIPLKNIRPLDGVPILGRVLDSLQDSPEIGDIFVSTDHAEIAAVARSRGAEVIRRGKASARDEATLHEVVVEVLELLSGRDLPSIGLCVLPTAALVRPETYTEAVKTFRESKYDSMMSVLPFPHPVERAFLVDDRGQVQMKDPAQATTRTQDLPRSYFDAGQLYLFRTKEIHTRSTLRGPNCGALVLDPMEAQDIDTLEDWIIAERKLKLQLRS